MSNSDLNVMKKEVLAIKKEALKEKLKQCKEIIDDLSKKRSKVQKELDGGWSAACGITGLVLVIIYFVSTGSCRSDTEIISSVGWGGFILFAVVVFVVGSFFNDCNIRKMSQMDTEFLEKKHQYKEIEKELKEIENQLAQIPRHF
jgi:peptidoglycan hydrolase CwlO-like protein